MMDVLARIGCWLGSTQVNGRAKRQGDVLAKHFFRSEVAPDDKNCSGVSNR